MQSYLSTWRYPRAVTWNNHAESHSHAVLPLYIATVSRRRFSLVWPFSGAEGRILMCRCKLMKEPSSKCAFIASPSCSSPSPGVMQSLIPFGKHLRSSGFAFLMKEVEDLRDHGRYFNSCVREVIMVKIISLRLILNALWVTVLGTAKRDYEFRLSQGKKGVLGVVAAMICLTCPIFTMTDDLSIVLSKDVALAQSVGQIRQAAMFLERLGGSTPTKVLDKVMTVISGQTVVTPETVDQLKAILEGEKDPKDWQTDLGNNAETLWSTMIDVVSQFNPISLLEATGNGIQGLAEGAAERFAAFELSTLVALGERWILWAPFFILPMYWQMTRNKNEERDSGSGGYAQGSAVEVSKDVALKAARVRDELERIEVKASLLDLVSSLGKLAWQINGNDQNTKRRQIDELLIRLQDLSPTSSNNSEGVFVPSTELPSIQHLMDVDGEWNLIYVTQDSSTEGEQLQFTQLLSLNMLGFELTNLQQKLWTQGLKSGIVVSESGAQCLEAKNTAHIRLGPLGVVEISVQGSWENQKDGKSAVVSFRSFSAKPVELLGSRVREDIPPVNLAIPTALQTKGEWKTVYLDNSLRINKGRTGQLFLFRKMG